MGTPLLYRKRIIPEECIPLKDDIILSMDEEMIITKWNTIRPKKDLHHGFSCYCLKDGFKISKFMKEDNSLLYWYCDIIKTDYDKDSDTYVFTDLLADVIEYPDGYVKVVDIDEIAQALKEKKLPEADVITLLTNLDKLLNIIYKNEFGKYKDLLNSYDK